MNKKDRCPLGKKIKYALDDFISKGILPQILLLAGTSLILTLLFGIITMKLGEENYQESYWISLMHMIDQGTITSDEKGTDWYFLFMLFVTLVGMAFTSTIIAILSSGIQEKLNELKKGHSGIIERDHVVILGFDENTYTICRETMESSRLNGEKICLVVADDLPKEEMEHTLREHLGGNRQYVEKVTAKKVSDRQAKILFRSGDLTSENTLSICSTKNAKSIVINRENDIETLRILLALVGYFKKNGISSENMPCIIAPIHNRDNLYAALSAAEIEFDGQEIKDPYNVQIIHDGYILENLFARTCVLQGFPYVMDGLFNYRGSSIYIEEEFKTDDEEDSDRFIGKTLPEIAETVVDAIPLGFASKDPQTLFRALLNPSEQRRYQIGDRLIYLSGKSELQLGDKECAEPVGKPVSRHRGDNKCRRNFLIIGWSGALSDMMTIVDRYCLEGSSVSMIISEAGEADGTAESVFDFRTIRCEDPYNSRNINRIFEENSFWFDGNDSRHLTNIVLLSHNGLCKALADEKTTMLLLNIRQYLKDTGNRDISITSEMRLPQNQMLLQKNSSKDFVIASEITNRLIAQITDDPRKYYIISELLEQKSAAIELYPLSDYADISRQFNFECIFQSAATMGKDTGRAEIPLGWIRVGHEEASQVTRTDDLPVLVLNPTKEDREKLYPGGSYNNYRLIVLVRAAQ